MIIYKVLLFVLLSITATLSVNLSNPLDSIFITKYIITVAMDKFINTFIRLFNLIHSFYTFSLAVFPNKPVGLKRSIIINMMKAIASLYPEDI